MNKSTRAIFISIILLAFLGGVCLGYDLKNPEVKIVEKEIIKEVTTEKEVVKWRSQSCGSDECANFIDDCKFSIAYKSIIDTPAMKKGDMFQYNSLYYDDKFCHRYTDENGDQRISNCYELDKILDKRFFKELK